MAIIHSKKCVSAPKTRTFFLKTIYFPAHRVQTAFFGGAKNSHTPFNANPSKLIPKSSAQQRRYFADYHRPDSPPHQRAVLGKQCV